MYSRIQQKFQLVFFFDQSGKTCRMKTWMKSNFHQTFPVFVKLYRIRQHIAFSWLQHDASTAARCWIKMSELFDQADLVFDVFFLWEMKDSGQLQTVFKWILTCTTKIQLKYGIFLYPIKHACWLANCRALFFHNAQWVRACKNKKELEKIIQIFPENFSGWKQWVMRNTLLLPWQATISEAQQIQC